MWIPKKKWNDLERKIAALEKEQLSIKKYVDENIKTDEELIEIVKKAERCDSIIRSFDTYRMKLIP